MTDHICGVGVALVTPFDEDYEVDYATLEKIVEYVITGGVDYIVALGTTAETPTLDASERDLILDTVKRASRGRVPLVAGVGGNSTSKVAGEIARIDKEGVSAILSVTPYYNKPTQEGLYNHYMRLAEDSSLPLILYNVPSRTGVNLEAETTVRLAHDHKNIIGIKEACGHVPQIMKILAHRPQGFMVVSGDDCMALPLIAMGGDGVISVAANAFAPTFTTMVRHACAGERDEAAALGRRHADALEALFSEGNPAGIKAALEVKGIATGRVRLPLAEASGSLKSHLAQIITANGI